MEQAHELLDYNVLHSPVLARLPPALVAGIVAKPEKERDRHAESGEGRKAVACRVRRVRAANVGSKRSDHRGKDDLQLAGGSVSASLDCRQGCRQRRWTCGRIAGTIEPRIVNRSSHGDACGRTIIFLSRHRSKVQGGWGQQSKLFFTTCGHT